MEILILIMIFYLCFNKIKSHLFGLSNDNNEEKK